MFSSSSSSSNSSSTAPRLNASETGDLPPLYPEQKEFLTAIEKRITSGADPLTFGQWASAFYNIPDFRSVTRTPSLQTRNMTTLAVAKTGAGKTRVMAELLSTLSVSMKNTDNIDLCGAAILVVPRNRIAGTRRELSRWAPHLVITEAFTIVGWRKFLMQLLDEKLSVPDVVVTHGDFIRANSDVPFHTNVCYKTSVIGCAHQHRTSYKHSTALELTIDYESVPNFKPGHDDGVFHPLERAQYLLKVSERSVHRGFIGIGTGALPETVVRAIKEGVNLEAGAKGPFVRTSMWNAMFCMAYRTGKLDKNMALLRSCEGYTVCTQHQAFSSSMSMYIYSYSMKKSLVDMRNDGTLTNTVSTWDIIPDTKGSLITLDRAHRALVGSSTLDTSIVQSIFTGLSPTKGERTMLPISTHLLAFAAWIAENNLTNWTAVSQWITATYRATSKHSRNRADFTEMLMTKGVLPPTHIPFALRMADECHETYISKNGRYAKPDPPKSAWWRIPAGVTVGVTATPSEANEKNFHPDVCVMKDPKVHVPAPVVHVTRFAEDPLIAELVRTASGRREDLFRMLITGNPADGMGSDAPKYTTKVFPTPEMAIASANAIFQRRIDAIGFKEEDAAQRNQLIAKQNFVINSLKRVASEDADRECPICYEEDHVADTMTACGHWFCERCITDWLVKHNKCPQCRCAASHKDLRKVKSLGEGEEKEKEKEGEEEEKEGGENLTPHAKVFQMTMNQIALSGEKAIVVMENNYIAGVTMDLLLRVGTEKALIRQCTTGKNGATIAKEIMLFRTGHGTILLLTWDMLSGLDIPHAQHLVFFGVMPGSMTRQSTSALRIIQAIGRIVRPGQEGTPRIHFMVSRTGIDAVPLSEMFNSVFPRETVKNPPYKFDTRLDENANIPSPCILSLCQHNNDPLTKPAEEKTQSAASSSSAAPRATNSNPPQKRKESESQSTEATHTDKKPRTAEKPPSVVIVIDDDSDDGSDCD